MKLTPAMTYAQGKEQVITLVDQERTDMALAKQSLKVAVKPAMQPEAQHDFSMSSNHVTMTRDAYDSMVAAAAASVYVPARQQRLSPREGVRADVGSGLCFRCKRPGHQIKDCPQRPSSQQQSTRPAFIRPTAAQNEQIQAFLRGESRQLGNQSTSRKRGVDGAEAEGAPTWKKSATPGWVPRGTKPTAAVSVESDADQVDELIGAAGVINENGDDDFDAEVYRPDGYHSD